eukprot:11673_1
MNMNANGENSNSSTEVDNDNNDVGNELLFQDKMKMNMKMNGLSLEETKHVNKGPSLQATTTTSTTETATNSSERNFHESPQNPELPPSTLTSTFNNKKK